MLTRLCQTARPFVSDFLPASQVMQTRSLGLSLFRLKCRGIVRWQTLALQWWASGLWLSCGASVMWRNSPILWHFQSIVARAIAQDGGVGGGDQTLIGEFPVNLAVKTWTHFCAYEVRKQTRICAHMHARTHSKQHTHTHTHTHTHHQQQQQQTLL